MRVQNDAYVLQLSCYIHLHLRSFLTPFIPGLYEAWLINSIIYLRTQHIKTGASPTIQQAITNILAAIFTSIFVRMPFSRWRPSKSRL